MNCRSYLAAFFLIPFVHLAQGTFEKAYIIMPSGDTIRGEAKVNPKKTHDLFNKVMFRDANGVQKNYKPEKIKGFGVGNDHFVAMDSDGEMRFYKVLARGEVTLYKMMYEAIEMNKTVIDYEYYLDVPGSKKLTVVKPGKFRKQLTEALKDDPAIAESYEDQKHLNEEKAVEIINNYNTRNQGK